MKPKKYKVMIDIYKGVLNNQLIEFTTQDHESNVLEFEILEDKVTPYNLDGCLVRMVINGQQQDCTIADATNGLVNITLHQSMFSEVGPVFAELQIYDAVNQTIRLTTPIFKYTVRKSLMDDNTVQADPNYSILQNMILEVSSADEVAKQAKKTAESAMTTANKAESKANQIMSNGDYAKEQGDYAKAEGDRLQGMLTLDGAPQTKFDFIENKVVQDGLVNLVIDKGGVTSNVEFKQDKEFSISVYAQHSVGTSGNKNIVGVQSVYQQYGWFLAMKGDTGNIQLISNTVGKETSVMVGNVSDGAFHRYDLIYKNHKITISIDGVSMGIYDLIFTDGGDKRIKTGANSQGQPLNMYKYFYIYDRELFSQDIERNFLVLNNSQSISHLDVTDTTGKRTLLTSTDSYHTVMDTGRNIQEELDAYRAIMAKEFTRTDGSPIEINNAFKSKVLGMSIKGQTVRCLASKPTPTNLNRSGTREVWFAGKVDLSPIHEYKVTINATLVVGTCNISILNKEGNSIFSNAFTIKDGENTFIASSLNINTEISHAFLSGSSSSDASCTVNYINIVDGIDKNKISGNIPFGLSSTQAIISNNGQQYPFYASEEDKANKKVISLPFPEDKLILNEDGSATWIDASNRKTLNNNEPWIKSSVQNAEANCFQIEIIDADNNGNSVIVFCDKLESVTGASTLSAGTLKPNTCGIDGSRYLRVGVPKTVDTVEQMKEFAQNLNIIYRSKIQEITHIDKSIVPNILTHKTNILEAGGAVKPSSFKVTVPVDKLAEIEARLQALESTTVDVVLNK